MRLLSNILMVISFAMFVAFAITAILHGGTIDSTLNNLNAILSLILGGGFKYIVTIWG